MQRIVVVFPAPLGPRNPKISPRSMLMEMPRTARSLPYDFSSLSITMTGSWVVIARPPFGRALSQHLQADLSRSQVSLRALPDLHYAIKARQYDARAIGVPGQHIHLVMIAVINVGITASRGIAHLYGVIEKDRSGGNA